MAAPKWYHPTRTLSTLFFLASSAFAVPKGAAYIPSKDYPDVAESEIDAARSSIDLYLYLFSYKPAQADAGPARLAQALVRARKRGLRVAVVLDRGVRDLDPDFGGDKNRAASDFLRAGGVDVSFSSGTDSMHAKALVLDEKTVLLGSANWSASAFTKNGEASALIRSTVVASGLLRELGAFPRQAPADTPPGFQVPAAFLTREDLLGNMVRLGDERSFDAALFLLRRVQTFPPSPDGSFTVPTEDLSRALGLPGPTRTDDRRQIHRTLLRLRDRYRLITLEESFGKDPSVRLADLPADEALRLPNAYADLGWDRRLSFAGKVFVLLNLYYSAVSPLSPRWSFGANALAQRHHVSPWFIRQGVVALRRANLVEVQYDDLPIDVAAPRHANTYTPDPFYDPAVLQARLQSLEGRFGAAAVARAKKIAALVYEDSDVNAVEQLVLLERERGPEVIARAVRIIGAKDPDNPRRSIAYLLATIKSLIP